jgi:ubiquitin carboxyl-terminal hydrolase 48
MGDLLSVKYVRHLAHGLLNLIFTHDLNNLESMLEAVLQGQEWHGVVQVPVCFRRFLAVLESNWSVGPARPRVRRGMSSLSLAGSAHLEDGLEIPFHIGNSFTAHGAGNNQRRRKQSVIGASMMFGRPSLQVESGVKRSSSVTCTPQASGYSGEAGGPAAELTATPYSQSQAGAGGEAHGARRFMQLLDRAGKPRASGLRIATGDAASCHPAAGEVVRLPPISRGVSAHRSSTSISPCSTSQPVCDGPVMHGPHHPSSAEMYESAELERADAHQVNPQEHFSGADDESSELDDEEDDLDGECYHELHAIPLLDPVLDKQVNHTLQAESQCALYV